MLTRYGGLFEDGSDAAIDRLNAVGEAQFELGLAALAHGLLPNHATVRRRHATRCHGYANLLKMDSPSRP